MTWPRVILYVLPLSALLALAGGLYFIVKDAGSQLQVERQAELQQVAVTFARLIADDPRYRLLLSGESSVSYFAMPVHGIDLDGRVNDWPESGAESLGLDYLVEINDAYSVDSLTYDLRTGADDSALYLHLRVLDDTVVFREISNLSVHRNDHVQIAFTGTDGQFRRYTLAAYQPGHVEAMEIGRTGRALRSEEVISGRWLATENGYNLEFQVPLALLAGRFSLVVADVDSESDRDIQFLVGKSATQGADQLGYLVTGLTPLQQLVADMPWQALVADRQGNILADTTTSTAGVVPVTAQIQTAAGIIGEVSLFAGSGAPLGLTKRHVIGAVLLLAACLLLGLTTLVLVARQLDQSLATSAREVEKIRQYNEYLERMAARLNHELQTPLSVIRSSLDHLDPAAADRAGDRVYLERATEGVQRLTNILNKMAEARRLEEALDEDEIHRFNLVEVVRGCVAGYELAYPQTRFDLVIEEEDLPVTGIPELIAQAFDKLIDNAVEFSSGAAIRVRLHRESGEACLRVLNEGANLPEASTDSLFESMVSIRGAGAERHLGLGLYVARSIVTFHGGNLSLNNREDTAGVVATIRLPILRLTAKLS